MVPSMKEIMNMVRSMVLEHLNGLMGQCTSASFITITFTEKEFTHGQMVVSMRVNGETTKCMEKAHSPGLMAESTLASMLMIKNKATVNSFGQMVDVIREIGKVANNTERGYMSPVKVMKSTVNGKTERESDGLVKREPNDKKILIKSIRFYIII